MNIILTGFMGTGKSTVGRVLAKELGLKFLDMDSVIEEEAGCSVKDIFARYGEAAFRARERELVGRLASGEFGEGLVVATGGGAVVNDGSRTALKAWGTLVCLTAPIDEIVKRVGSKADRPLLADPEKRGRVESLLEARGAAYSDCHVMVDTGGMAAEEAARKVRSALDAIKESEGMKDGHKG